MRMQTMNGGELPRIGQGTWFLGEHPERAQEEMAALQAGVEAGMTLIDTAEMYGNGASEILIGKAIRHMDRDGLFLVSKVYPSNAGGARLERSCEDSLRRLGTDVIDLYLLHWRGSIPFSRTIEGMRKLQQEGKIRYWGVSNLDRDDIEELRRAGGSDCQVDQVLYHLGSRGVEYDLLPYLQEKRMPMMAYCPLAQAGSLRRGLMQSPAVREVANRHGWTAAQVLLAFAAQPEGVIAIPRASRKEHTLLNAAMEHEHLTPADMEILNAAFPAPDYPEPLDIV